MQLLLVIAGIYGSVTSAFKEGDRVHVVDTGDDNAYLSGTVINVERVRIGTLMHEFYEVQMADGRIMKEHSDSLRPFNVKIVKRNWFSTETSDLHKTVTHPFTIGSAVRVAHNSSIWNECRGITESYRMQGTRLLVMVRLQLPAEQCNEYFGNARSISVLLFPHMLKRV